MAFQNIVLKNYRNEKAMTTRFVKQIWHFYP
jgi:hypothetical protein